MITASQCLKIVEANRAGGYAAAGKLAIEFLEGAPKRFLLLSQADGELSAIAHGRPPSDDAELLRLSDGLRELCK